MLTALFDSGVGVGKFTARVVDLPAVGFQFLRHAIERTHQIADFVSG